MVTIPGHLQEVVDKHSDKEVLETCAKTLERLCDDRHAIYSRCEIARSKLLDMVSNGFKEANDEYMNLLQGKKDKVFNLVSSLKKVECFSNPHNMSQWKIWDGMFDILIRLKECLANSEEIKLPVEALRSAVCACYYGLVWDR